MLRAGLWHRGMQHLLSADAPAAGKEWSLEMPTVPEGVHFRIKSVMYNFTTSVAVANRASTLVYAAGQQIYARMTSPTVQAASIVGQYSFYEARNSNNISPTAASILVGIPLAFDGRVRAGQRIGSQTELIDVGDQYSQIVVVAEEWIYEPPGERSPHIGDGSDRVDTVKLNKTMERIAQLLEAQTATP